MDFGTAIMILYAVPALYCLRSFQAAAANYERLPERIPMHFGFSGRADVWWRKSRFSVFFLPAVNLGVFVMMAVILFMIHRDGGAPTDDLNAAWFAFTFSMAFTLYSLHDGTIRYATGEVESIWRRVGPGAAAVVLSSVLLFAAPFIPIKPSIARAVMCAGVEGNAPVGARDAFSLDDERAVLHLTLKNVKGNHGIRVEWLNPSGEVYFVSDGGTGARTMRKYLPWWSYVTIRDRRERIVPGTWRVEASVDGRREVVRRFEITAAGAGRR
ncbi:MAG: DUF1648 domain-containing protein [bacterium]